MTTDLLAESAQIRWQNATVEQIAVRTPRVTSFFFRLERPFAYLAGQHVDVRLTAPDGYQAMRSYSIASAPSSGSVIELAVERLDDGEVSPFFHDVLAVGDAIELRGPLGGHFIWTPRETEPLLLVGGGSGVVPLTSMIRERRLAGATVPLMLLYSARTWSELLYPDELLALEGAHDGFTIVFTLTREAAKRPTDFARRIDPAMLREVLGRFVEAPGRVYVCGSNAFVDTSTESAIAAGVPSEIIRTERYGV